MSAILKFEFQKKKTISFFWSKLSKLHKKDPILHIFPKTRGNKNRQAGIDYVKDGTSKFLLLFSMS